MIDLRTLLIDCRIAVRNASGNAGGEELIDRLDKAIQEVSRSGAKSDADTKAKPSVAQKVALAWQTAARGLKISHPELYEQLSQRVMGMLDTRTLDEPTDELLRLESEAEKLRRNAAWTKGELDRLQARAEQAQESLAQLQEALAAAVPDLSRGDDPQMFAKLCIQELVRAAKRTGPGIKGESGAGQDTAVPSRTVLEQIAAGARNFNSGQRDWTISEAMCLTGWQFTPVELIEKGDAWLARLLLDKGNIE
ncbi:MAG TPA: hypothetical protein PKZ76_02630 [Xanthomonadaceae bacterium]|nr:hypothetical protein [Xanthomonadaceae bacterium]